MRPIFSEGATAGLCVETTGGRMWGKALLRGCMWEKALLQDRMLEKALLWGRMQSLRKLLRIARQFVLQWVNIAGQLSGNIKRRSLDSQQQRILWQNLT